MDKLLFSGALGRALRTAQSFRGSEVTGVRIPPDERYRGTISLAPRIYEGEGPHSGRGSLPHGGESLLSHGFAVPAPPEGKPRALRTVLAPRIYEGGGPHSGRGSLSAAAGTALSVALRADMVNSCLPGFSAIARKS